MRNKRETGSIYESMAADYLKEQGFEVVERNVYTRRGEIDIIAKEQEYLCFVEVKYRKGNDCGEPSEAVTRNKQRRIYGAARVYLYRHHISFDTPCRFDVVEISGKEIHLIRNAYGGL